MQPQIFDIHPKKRVVLHKCTIQKNAVMRVSFDYSFVGAPTGNLFLNGLAPDGSVVFSTRIKTNRLQAKNLFLTNEEAGDITLCLSNENDNKPAKLRVLSCAIDKLHDRFFVPNLVFSPTSTTVAIATYPLREAIFPDVLDSLVGQADNILVYLNNYREVPLHLRKYTAQDGVHFILDSASTKRAAAKFSWVEREGYHIICDDDIIYPPNYVRTLVDSLRGYGHKAVVGVHGAIFERNINAHNLKNYRKDIFRFQEALEADTPVHMLGTGTIALHSDTVKDFNWDLILKHNISNDQSFAVNAKRAGVPLICLKRAKRWMKTHPDMNFGIYEEKQLVPGAKDAAMELLIKNSPWQPPVMPKTTQGKKTLSTLLGLTPRAHRMPEIDNGQGEYKHGFALCVDGQPSELVFNAEKAALKAKSWDKLEGGGVNFTFAHDVVGYMVTDGNQTNFQHAQPAHNIMLDGFKAVFLSAELDNFDTHAGGIGLYCLIMDAQGYIIKKSQLNCQYGKAEGWVELPDNAHSMAFALRLMGKGFFANLRIRAMRRTVAMPVLGVVAMDGEEAVFHPQAQPYIGNSNNILEILQQCLKAHNYVQGLLFSQHPNAQTDYKAALLRWRCHTALQNFAAVMHEYEACNNPTLKNKPEALLHYVRALVALGQSDKVLRTVLALLYSYEANTAQSLLKLYPFVATICPKTASYVRIYIAQQNSVYKAADIDPLIRVLHDLLLPDNYAEFSKILACVQNLKLKAPQQEKLLALMAQAAYLRQDYAFMIEKINQIWSRQSLFAVDMPSGVLGHVKKWSMQDWQVSSCPVRSVMGPAVSVIMPAYNCADTIGYALESLMRQSYADMEIIVVDDASTDNTANIVLELAQLDPRIRLITLPRNQGAYVARNTGMAEASGVFVTVQDADDWAHPQKIERLALALQDNPKWVAVGAQLIRYSPEKGLRARGGYLNDDGSSLMYRKLEVTQAIGYHDNVRMGGDTEYIMRMARYFGAQAVHYLPDLLSIALWSDRSLSAGAQDGGIDEDTGILSPIRQGYRQSFLAWQEYAPSLYLSFPQTVRPFAIDDRLRP